MSSWPLRIVVILFGFAAGFVIYRANTADSRSCGKWADVSTAIVEHTEDLMSKPTLNAEAEGNLNSAANEMEIHRDTYSEHRWHTATPSEPASDLLVDATRELAEPNDHRTSAANLKESIRLFSEVCR